MAVCVTYSIQLYVFPPFFENILNTSGGTFASGGQFEVWRVRPDFVIERPVEERK
jgi:hypothetical protein